VNLAEVAPDLTFVDSVVNKLVVKNDGQVNPQLLKTMLELSSGSAAMLERLWLLTSLRKAL
jgi:hypothetical protein